MTLTFVMRSISGKSTTVTCTLLLLLYWAAAICILNLGFPIFFYIKEYGFSQRYVISSFLSLSAIVTAFTAAVLPLAGWSGKPLWVRVLVPASLQFIVVAGFAVLCSGAGFGWSISSSSPLGRFSFFFTEYEWLRFILEAAMPLTAAAGVVYWIVGRQN